MRSHGERGVNSSHVRLRYSLGTSSDDPSKGRHRRTCLTGRHLIAQQFRNKAQTHQQPDTCSLTPSFSRFLSSPASRTSSRKDYRSRDIICPADTSCHLFFPPLRSPTSHNYRTSLPRLTRHEAGLLDPTIRTVVLRLPHVRILTGGT